MNVLVTGGAGYIGSHATRLFLDSGHKVVVLDDLSHGHRAAVDPRAVFVQANTGDGPAVQQAMEAHRIEAVVHFAAFIEVGESVTDPGKYYDNNVRCALSVFDAMRRAGVGKVIFSSTAAVYGNPEATPIVETHPRRPINPYGRSKNMVETILWDYAAAYDFAVVALRYFNVAGAAPDGTIGEAHEPESHLIPRVLAAAGGGVGQEAVIYGTDYPTPDGTCVRDYVHVEDLVRAHLLALKYARPGRPEAFNVGSARGFSVREVIDTVSRVVGHQLRVVERPRRPGDPAVLVASSERIRKELGFELAYPDLETIIAHAWQWHRTHPRGYAGSEPSPGGPR